MKYLILLLTLTACAPTPEISLGESIGQEFQGYVKEFDETFQVTTQATVQFSDTLPDNMLGLCTTFTRPNDFLNIVSINRKFWETANDWQKEQLIFHELGHCELGLKHDDFMLDYGLPKSLMNKRAIDWWVYRDNREYYLNELKEK